MFESSPEMERGLRKFFNEIYKIGELFIDKEMPVQPKHKEDSKMAYYHMILQPIEILIIKFTVFQQLAQR